MKPDAIANVNAFGVYLFSTKQLSGWNTHAGAVNLKGSANLSRPSAPARMIAYLRRRVSGLRRARILAILLTAVLGWTLACSRSEANQYDPGEANILVAAAYSAKDGECGTTHTFNSILFFPADRENVQLCVVAILETNCTNWSVADPTPDSCKFIGVQFES